MNIRAYLRASTDEQDATRALEYLKEFAASKNKAISASYIENISGTKLERPELDKLLRDSSEGDVLLVEKLDRLTRLPYEQWKILESKISDKKLKILVVDLTTTHDVLSPDKAKSAMAIVITEFIVNMASVQARDDYETRRLRQAQGIAAAKEADKTLPKEEKKYKGTKENLPLQTSIRNLLLSGTTWNTIIETLKCSRSTIQKVSKQIKAEQAE